MWKNFRDVGALAERIGAVVAPPPKENDDNSEGSHKSNDDVIYHSFHPRDKKNYYANDDDEDDEEDENDDDDEGEFDDDDDEEVSEDESEDEGKKQGAFGFMSIIRRTINDMNVSTTHSEGEEDEDEILEERDKDTQDVTSKNHEQTPYINTATITTPSPNHNGVENSTNEYKEKSFKSVETVSQSIDDGRNDQAITNQQFETKIDILKLAPSFDALLSGRNQETVQQHSTPDNSNNDEPITTVIHNTILESQIPEPAFLGLRREQGSVSPQRSIPEKEIVTIPNDRDDIIPYVDSNSAESDGDLEDDDEDEEDEEVEDNHSPDDASLSEHSDLDGNGNAGRPRFVSRLQNKDATTDNNNQDSNPNADTDESFRPPRRRISSARRLRGSSYSTDSLLEGDFGRKLREQRRQKRRNDGNTTTSSSRSQSPTAPVSSTNRPNHRIVEVPKNDELLKKVATRRKPPAHAYSDDEHDELDVPLHKGRQVSPNISPRESNNLQILSPVQSGLDKFTSMSPSLSIPTSDPNKLGSTDTRFGFSLSPKKNYSSAVPLNNLPNISMTEASAPDVKISAENGKKIEQLEQQCKDLTYQLQQRENQILALQQQLSIASDRDSSEQDRFMELFKEKEQRLLEAAAEDHQYEMRVLQEEMQGRIREFQREIDEERNSFEHERGQIEFLLEEVKDRAAKAEKEAQQQRAQMESAIAQLQQQHARVLRSTEDKLVQALTLLEEKSEKEQSYIATIEALQSKMNEHHEGAQEVEDELEEIQSENEQLHAKIDKLEAEKKQLRDKVEKLQGDSDKLAHLKLEMRMLKEDNEREKAKRQNVAASAESASAQLIADRDAALADVQDLKQQLAASRADFEVCKSDSERLITANNNLQAALEAFQMEREAELAIWEENKAADEKALAAAHEVALDVANQTHKTQLEALQKVADTAVQNSMNEIKMLEQKLEMFRVENNQMRRSLDEAIHRLQATQDDVVDRTFMKNVLFDWLTKKGVKERREVLEVMANILHFTEEEKERVHIGHSSHIGLSSIVGTLPEPKADIDHLEGENVREKWVNFLLAETDD